MQFEQFALINLLITLVVFLGTGIFIIIKGYFYYDTKNWAEFSFCCVVFFFFLLIFYLLINSFKNQDSYYYYEIFTLSGVSCIILAYLLDQLLWGIPYLIITITNLVCTIKYFIDVIKLEEEIISFKKQLL